MQADQELKALLIDNKKGFKWKSLINQDSNKRYQVMQMSKPKELVVSDRIAVNRKMKVQQECIVVKAALIYFMQKEASDN